MNAVGLITYQVEDWDRVVEELRPLFTVHHAEIGLYQSRMPLSPQWWEYARLARLGQMLAVTARLGGTPIGYCILIVGVGMHYSTTLTARMDAIWVDPHYRTGSVGRRLLDATKAELERRGVRLWWMGSKDHKPIEALYRRMGFEKQESFYSLWLGDAE